MRRFRPTESIPNHDEGYFDGRYLARFEHVRFSFREFWKSDAERRGKILAIIPRSPEHAEIESTSSEFTYPYNSSYLIVNSI